jgi:hypothetical protein
MMHLKESYVGYHYSKHWSVAVRWRAKRAEPILSNVEGVFASIFLLHFLHQGKKWKRQIDIEEHNSNKVRSLVPRDDKDELL